MLTYPLNFVVGFLTTVALVSQATALPDKNDVDSKSPSVVSRLDPVLRKALLQALSNLERNTSEDEENVEFDSTTSTTVSDEILEESTIADQTPAIQYHSFVVDSKNDTSADDEIIQTIIVKAPQPTVSSSLDVDEVSEQSDNDVIIKFDKLDPVKESDIRVETVQVARSVSPSIRTNEITGETEDESATSKSSTKQLKKVTTYKPSTTTTTTTTTEAPTHNEDGENIERVKENDVKIYQAPLVTAFTIQQDGNGLPKNVIPLYKQDVVPASMALPVEQFSFSSHQTSQNFQNVPTRNAAPPPTFSVQTPHQPQPPVFNVNTFALEQKQKQLEQQIAYLQEQQRKQEVLFRQQQSYQDQQALQRQAQLLLEQRLRIEEDYRLRQQKYEQELKSYKEKQQVQLQSRFNQPSVVVEGQTTQSIQSETVKEVPQVDQINNPTQQQLPAQQQQLSVQQLPAPQQQQQFVPTTDVQTSQQNVQAITEVQSQQQLQVQPLQQSQHQDIELQRQIERQNEEYRIKTLKYEEDLKAYRQKMQAQQFAEQQQQQQQQLFSRQQLPFLPAQQFAPPQHIFNQGLPQQQQQQIRFNSNQPQFRTNVQIVPSVQFQSFQVPTQQMLPIREPQTFRSRSQNEFQQQTNIPQLSPVQELPLRSFQQFHTSGPIILNSNIDPVIAAPPDAIQRNRVFRQESDTGNFFNQANNRITLNPINNNADNYLQSLLFQSGISGRQNEDLNIITKVLALNHGIQSSPNDQQQIRFPRRENV
ncbi:hypothetical protein Bhyg_11263 [Pseudolycoriella hygida]|uniref:Uncharacterized protein n=1 Tax=Pseudolycoriella hygida TaxID=35572 RepID=A0A9Q0MV06_9DIPT|nr:hypothetical protein Bhyg_11263 [Pseudolycoriella hygida]